MLRNLRDALEDFRGALRTAQPAPALPDEAPAELSSDEQVVEQVAPSEMPAGPEGNGAVGSTSALEPTPRTPSRPRRLAWVGLAALALAGLLVLRWAPWDAGEPADPEVVATYQGGTVTREQLRRQLEAIPKGDQLLYRSADGLKALVGDLVVHEVTRRWAEEKQVDQKQVFKEAMKHATEEIQIADVSDQLHQGRIQVGEAEIQAYYDQNRTRFGERPLVEVKDEIRRALIEEKEQAFVEGYLKDLRGRASLQVDYSLLAVPEPTEPELLAYYQTNRERFRVPEQARIAQVQTSISLSGGDAQARAKAESARARAAAGEEFAQVAQELSNGPEKAGGGELASPAARGSRAPEFDAAVFPLQVGELSPVFKEGDSYYVVKLLERTPERLRPYEEARAEIADSLRAEREGQVYAERKDRTLFTIHSRRTTFGEFLQELEELPTEARAQYPGPEGKRKLLDALIERLLVVEDASEQAVDSKRGEDIQHARSDLLAQLLHREEVDEKAKASDEEVRAEYERNRARYAVPPRVRVRYIRVSRGTTADADQKARAKIEEAEGRVRPGGLFGGGQPADFAEVARQYSEDPETAAKGGELDRWLGETGDALGEILEHALHQELLPLKVGEVSRVLPLDDSYYLFQVREKQEARPRSFEEAKELVRRDLEVRRHEELTRTMERDLLDRMQLRIYDGRIQAVLADLGGSVVGSR